MTSTVASARDLLTDDDFLTLCQFWERDCRVPLIMPDWLREKGLDRQAAVADWCLSEPDKPLYIDEVIIGGPTPSQAGGVKYGWWRRESGFGGKWYADDLEYYLALNMKLDWVHNTFEEAIVYLLDNYQPEKT